MSSTAIPEKVQELLATREPAHLGPQSREGVLEESVLNRRLGAVLELQAHSVTQTELIRAVILLWHDHLEAAHEIAQGIETPSGSFIHAIMHRREPDYANSNYWWQRTRSHPCFPEIARRVTGLLEGKQAQDLRARLLPESQWSPQAFVDACERVAGRPATDPEVLLLREIQRLEHEVLLEFLCRAG